MVAGTRVDEKATSGGGAVATLDAGVVVFGLATPISEDYNVCRRVPAACSAESCERGEGRKGSNKELAGNNLSKFRMNHTYATH